MNLGKLKRTADSLLSKHGDKIDRGLSTVEQQAKKRLKGRDRQIDRAAGTVRGALAKQRRP